jgi:vanillate/4-hydroxybenzoate decarboxylase subunit D
MSKPMQSAPNACPRCRSHTTRVEGTSPVDGIWTVFSCTTCFYAWRSTEPQENRDPNKYPRVFRLDPGELAKLPVAPTIPPLRRSSGGSQQKD